jgi:hypothetical protein
MTEPYHIQKERIRQGLIETHRPFDFYESDRFNALNNELQEAQDDIDLCIDVLADIETAKKNFVKSLPWWYKMRWSDLYMTDPVTYKEALEEYEKNIYNRL